MRSLPPLFCLLLSCLLCAGTSLLPASAQRLRWERPLGFAATADTDLFAYAKVLLSGNYLVHRASSTGSLYSNRALAENGPYAGHSKASFAREYCISLV